MTKKDKNFLIFASLGALSLSILAIASNEGQGFLATDTPTYQCADIVFGTAEYSNNAAVDTSDFTSTNITVSSISTCTYCYAVSGSAARIGKSSTQGVLTFNFTGCVISEAWVYCYRYGTDSSKSATFSLATSALSADSFKNVTATEAPAITSTNPSDLPSVLHWTGLDGGSGASSTTLTVKSTSTARVNLCKIVLKIVTGYTPAEKSLSNISVTTQPTKSSYTVNDTIDTTGLVITADYDDNSSADVTSSCTLSPANGTQLTTVGSQTVNVSYTYSGVTKTTSFSVTVTSASVTLQSIAVTTQPTKTSYTVGDTLDTTGALVTATYSDSTTADVTSSCSFSPTTLSTAGTQEITVSYSGKTTSFNVTVTAAKTLLNITSSGNLTTTSYTAGQSFSPAGLTITANYSGSLTEDVTSQVTWSPSTLSVGDTSVTGSYTYGGTTKTVIISGITVSSGSGKTLMVRMNEMLADMYCDSIFIKYGDWECLIDGGNSADKASVSSALNTYCTDHILDFYIGSHSHNDHLGIFTSATTTNNVFIDGGITSIGHIVDSGSARSAAFYTCYRNVRDNLVSTGKATYIPVHAFFNSDSGYTSFYGQNVFTIDSNVSLTFVNTGTYLTPGDSSTETGSSTYSPNRYSVACLFSAWNQRYFFSGDGDENTQTGIMNNNGGTTTNNLWSESNDVYLKANHHCSNTEGSNSQEWIDWCKPDHVIVCSAIVSANSGTSGVTAVQHPNPVAIQRFESATYDIHWTGINGTFSYTSANGATPVLAGTAKQVPYYYNGSAVTGEETTTFPMSKWCTYSTYSACARTASSGKDAKKITRAFHNYDMGFLYNSYLDTPVYDLTKDEKPAINEAGELYDSMTDSYC